MHLQIINDFYDYLLKWQEITDEKNAKFIPYTTFDGLKVTLKNTIQLMSYLTEKCSIKYLMTARLNQDALEVSKILYFFFILITRNLINILGGFRHFLE